MIKKLVFTGGHHNSALATIDWLQNHSDPYDFHWIGKKNVEGGAYSPEFTEVTEKNIPFYDLKAGKLYRATSIAYLPHVIFNLLMVPVGFFQAFYYLSKIKPDLIVSFGGYLSVPVVFAGYLLGINSVLHEQTATIGLANAISANFVQKIFTAWPEHFYSEEKDSIKKKIEYTGLPLRDSVVLKETHGKIEFPRENPTVYITGGKSGSLYINKTILEILPEISSKYNLIWSTGRRVGGFDYKKVNEAVSELPEEIQKNILVREYFMEDEIGKIFNTADIVITRGGAHTVYELALIKKPALVIPIPWVSRQEQLKNAKILEEFGLAKVLAQESLTPYKLLAELENFTMEIDNIRVVSKDKEYVPSNGQEKLGNAINQLWPS